MIIANPIHDLVFKYLLEASEKIRAKMDVEDELDRIFEREMKKLAAEKDEVIAEKDQLLNEEIQKNLELQRQIEELKKQIKP